VKTTKCQGPNCPKMIVRRPGKPVAKYHSLICAWNAMKARREGREAMQPKCTKCGQALRSSKQ